MLGRSVYFICIALSCIHAASEPLRSENFRSNHTRRRRSDHKDGLAISKEIFRNITKQLRDGIKRDGPEKMDRGILPKPGPYQAYHHHEHHWGPYFEGDSHSEGATAVVTAHVGSEALLHCRVGMLKDKTVMWLRRTADSAQLLTVGSAPYAGDSRISVRFQYPNNWRLSINPVRTEDAGPYMCQISTHPPRTILANLTVLPPILTINGDESHTMKDRFYKSGSSINLACVISEDFKPLPVDIPQTSTVSVTTPTTTLTTKTSTVFNRIDLVMNKSWSVETTTILSTLSLSKTTKLLEMTTTVAPVTEAVKVVNNVFGLAWKKQGVEISDGVKWNNMSITYTVPSASQNDSGTYTCHLRNHSQATVNVHVLIAGENQAAVHHDTWNKGNLFWTSSNLFLALVLPLPLVLK